MGREIRVPEAPPMFTTASLIESLRRLINQMKEEIIWTQVHRTAPHAAARS